MIYRVSWEPGAFQMLQQIWDEQDEPAELIHTLDEIHGILSVDAEQQGESRARGRRILISPPLGILFQTQPRLGQVLIVRVWTYRQRKG